MISLFNSWCLYCMVVILKLCINIFGLHNIMKCLLDYFAMWVHVDKLHELAGYCSVNGPWQKMWMGRKLIFCGQFFETNFCPKSIKQFIICFDWLLSMNNFHDFTTECGWKAWNLSSWWCWRDFRHVNCCLGLPDYLCCMIIKSLIVPSIKQYFITR